MTECTRRYIWRIGGGVSKYIDRTLHSGIISNVIRLKKPVGSTIIPVIGGSDEMHIMTYTGDGKLWPVYVSLGNINSSCHARNAMDAVFFWPWYLCLENIRSRVKVVLRL
jgi:hypothetical protein